MLKNIIKKKLKDVLINKFRYKGRQKNLNKY